jgi:predicted alpha/beta-hydrolase family hydrolase
METKRLQRHIRQLREAEAQDPRFAAGLIRKRQRLEKRLADLHQPPEETRLVFNLTRRLREAEADGSLILGGHSLEGRGRQRAVVVPWEEREAAIEQLEAAGCEWQED